MVEEPSPSRSRWQFPGAGKPAPGTYPDPPRRILLVSPSAPLNRETLQRVVDLAMPEHAKITVLGIAKVFGTSLGLPHPGLQPTRTEWEQQRKIVQDAADELTRRGFEVRVAHSRARNIPKMISRWGGAKNFHAIVVPEAERPPWRRMLEGDIATQIGRRSDIPVHVVSVPSERGTRPAEDGRR